MISLADFSAIRTASIIHFSVDLRKIDGKNVIYMPYATTRSSQDRDPLKRHSFSLFYTIMWECQDNTFMNDSTVKCE